MFVAISIIFGSSLYCIIQARFLDRIKQYLNGKKYFHFLLLLLLFYDGKRYAVSVYLLQGPEMKYVKIGFLNCEVCFCRNFCIFQFKLFRSSSLLICEYGQFSPLIPHCFIVSENIYFIPAQSLLCDCLETADSTKCFLLQFRTIEMKYLAVHSHVYLPLNYHYPSLLSPSVLISIFLFSRLIKE